MRNYGISDVSVTELGVSLVIIATGLVASLIIYLLERKSGGK